MASIPSPPKFTFTPSDTRLKITYKNAPAYAHVSSHAMALASPVWENFLFPPWAREADGEIDLATGLTKLSLHPVEELDFTEDNPEALLVLLCIAHLRFEDCLDDKPPRQVLIDLAILSDMHLCQHLVKPWAENWIFQEFMKVVKHPDESYTHTQWKHLGLEDYKVTILLAWVFRPKKEKYFPISYSCWV